jgi:ubiquinone/menaquinone biosynthesis C-methylase UbiE
MSQPVWQYDENVQVGVDYADVTQVQAYDARMRRLRDLPAELESVAGSLAIGPDSVAWDIGTGTGEIALGLALRCRRVYASDVSAAMLEFAGRSGSVRVCLRPCPPVL